MKKILGLFLFLVVSGMAAAHVPSSALAEFSIETSYDKDFTRIVVQDDIDLEVVSSPQKTISIDGDFRNIRIVNRRGVLYISSVSGSLHKKARVRVAVHNLKAIDVIGNSVVRSIGQLDAARLDIYIDGESQITLVTRGEIHIRRSEDTRLFFKKVSGTVGVRQF